MCTRLQRCCCRNLPSHASTAQRFGQWIIASETVQHDWEICTTDASKAFLQGVTYEELSEITGEEIREANSTPPRRSEEILRTFPGFPDFSPDREVLHCDKPGTGLVDAPRASNFTVGQVTIQCVLLPTPVDPALVINSCLQVRRRSNVFSKMLIRSIICVLQ